MREQATRTGRRSRKGIACAAVLACVLGAGCLAWGCTPAAAPSDGADKTADSTTTTEPAPATSDGYSDQLASISGFPTATSIRWPGAGSPRRAASWTA